MKTLLVVLGAILMCSCAGSGNDNLQAFVPGSYVRYAQHEFGKEWDTLMIIEQNVSANQYKVERRWRYERVRDGQALEPEYKVTTSSGIYESAKEGIIESSTGKLFTFNEVQRTLFAGKLEYQKLK